MTQDIFSYKKRKQETKAKLDVIFGKKKPIIEYKRKRTKNHDNNLKILNKNLLEQKTIVSSTKKTIELKIRQIEALESIAESLKTITTQRPAAVENNFKTKLLPFLKKGLDKSSQEKLFEKITQMRKSKYTYAEIAKHLEDKKVPTLTGNGKWNTSLVFYFYKKFRID